MSLPEKTNDKINGKDKCKKGLLWKVHSGLRTGKVWVYISSLSLLFGWYEQDFKPSA